MMRLANQEAAAELSGQPMLPPAAAGPPAAGPNQRAEHTPENPARVATPADPEGFERIYEGSFLEGALITRLSGDFPGPVLAQVSVPVLLQRPPARFDPPVEPAPSARPRP